MVSIVAEQPVVDKSGARVRDMFAQIAGRYDRLNHLLSCNIDRYWRRRTVSLVPPSGSAPILDLCTGTGDLALAYRRLTGGTVPVVGADFCGEMLRLATAKQSKQGLSGSLAFLEADAMQLPFADSLFQIVSVAFGLRNVEDMDVGLREMTRVCQPGGKVAVLEFSMPQSQPWKGAYGMYFRHVLPRIGQWLARNDHDAYEYLPTSVGAFPSGSEFLEHMHQVDLRNTRAYPLTFGVATLYVGEKPLAIPPVKPAT